jgi:hypothetical protein
MPDLISRPRGHTASRLRPCHYYWICLGLVALMAGGCNGRHTTTVTQAGDDTTARDGATDNRQQPTADGNSSTLPSSHVEPVASLKGYALLAVGAAGDRLLLLQQHDLHQICVAKREVNSWKIEKVPVKYEQAWRDCRYYFLKDKDKVLRWHFGGEGPGEVETLDLQTGEITKLNVEGSKPRSAVASPFLLDRDRRDKLEEAVSHLRNDGNAVQFFCEVNCDGTKALAFDSDVLYVIDMRTWQARQIDKGVYGEPGMEFFPHWSGRGDLITYCKRLGDSFEGYVVSAGTSKRLVDRLPVCCLNVFVISADEALATTEQGIVRIGISSTAARD